MESESAPKREKHQIKALLIKNLHLQKRQPCTNCCQILTPIICLFFTILIRNAAIDNIPTQNDTIYAALPLISNKLNDYFLIDQTPEVVYREKEQWILFEVENPQDIAFVGNRHANKYSGMLSKVQNSYQYYQYLNNSIYPYTYNDYGIPPIFVPAKTSLGQELFDRYEYLNNDTFYSIRQTTAPQHLPDGAVLFHTANKTRLDATIRVKDIRELTFYRPNGISQIFMRADVNETSKYHAYFIIPEGFLSVMDMVSKAFIKHTVNKKITSGYTYMPFSGEGSIFIDMLINTIATIVFPLALSLLLPVFLYLVVLEKEEKLIQMMRMNGMSITNYWFINFLYNFLISLATNIVFYLFGYIFLDMSFFHNTSPLVLAIVFLGWILAQIGLSTFLQVFLSSSRAANIIGYLVAIWTNLIGATLSVAMFQFPIEQPIGFTMWPTFAFTRVFYLLFTYCSMDQCINSLSTLTPQMITCIIILYLSFPVFSLLGMYLFEVIPQQFGVSKPLLFPFHFMMDCIRKRSHKHHKDIQSEEEYDEITNSDATIQQQKENIDEIDDYSDHPLVIEKLTKKYDNGKLAVDRLNLMVEDRSIFGLLGPNGAGKTTLLSMITGIFGPTSGNAHISGYSISDQIDLVHLQMGVCPQFDILWPSLTVEEHLYFYARLRGVSSKEQNKKVNDTLKEVNLVEWRHSKVTQLSGGMKRRLSIGISLVGDPRIVFMDQPTTGLDPENRRHLWEVLANCRQKRALFLTTHLMEEAEILCDRVAIITNGTLRTVGDVFKLKEIYGRGYFVSVSMELSREQLQTSNFGSSYQSNHLSLNDDYDSSDSFRLHKGESVMTDSNYEQQIETKKRLISQASIRDSLLEIFAPATIVKEIGGVIKICVAESKVSVILEELRKLKEKEDTNFEWSITDSTLEDVFLEVVNRYDLQTKASLIDSVDPM